MILHLFFFLLGFSFEQYWWKVYRCYFYSFLTPLQAPEECCCRTTEVPYIPALPVFSQSCRNCANPPRCWIHIFNSEASSFSELLNHWTSPHLLLSVLKCYGICRLSTLYLNCKAHTSAWTQQQQQIRVFKLQNPVAVSLSQQRTPQKCFDNTKPIYRAVEAYCIAATKIRQLPVIKFFLTTEYLNRNDQKTPR